METQIEQVFPDIDTAWVDALRAPSTSNNWRGRDVQAISDKILAQGWYPKGSSECVDARNEYLTALVERFPDADVSHLRNLILERRANVSVMPTAKSIVYDATQALLKSNYPKRLRAGPLKEEEFFRNDAYIKGCRYRLLNDFPKHWKSTIKAVMAENNNDYTRSHQSLESMPTNSWLFAPFNFFKRKTYWCQEMFVIDLLESVDKLTALQRQSLITADFSFARTVNKKEYLSSGQGIECACCLDDCAFEDMCQCPDGHLFCMDCLRRHVAEGLFGQGQLRGKPVRCIDPGGCEKEFGWSELRRALSEDVLEAYEGAVVERELEAAGIDLVQCPFCSYAGW
ncbi:hypothetical protein HDV00_000341 [Rhizophlyctis rosea]|nr:hypothetical protein HDV00_000341 [Rhizophlyctis rosea]